VITRSAALQRLRAGAKAGLKACATAALALAIPARAFAQYGDAPPRPDAANAKPAILQNVGIDQRIGQQLPLDLTFKDETGRDVRLGEYFGRSRAEGGEGGKPVVLALAYYECPMLCTQVLNGMTGALKTLSFDAGADFEVVVVSIDPRDGFRMAAAKKTTYLESYGRPATAAGWHFLTGTEASIYVATPKGVVSRYLLGIDFAPRDLRLALVEASNNALGTVADQVLLLCYHYDPATGKYGGAVLNAIRVGFILTVGAFLTFLFVSLRRERSASAT
jgi:protein SCO1